VVVVDRTEVVVAWSVVVVLTGLGFFGLQAVSRWLSTAESTRAPTTWRRPLAPTPRKLISTASTMTSNITRLA
jgi:hypothetical protein